MSYFSVIPADLVRLTISDMTVDELLHFFQADPSVLKRLENNPYILAPFQFNLTSDDQKKKFRKLICNLTNKVTDKFLLSAIELNSVPLVEYGLRHGHLEFSLFDGSEIGRSGNRDIINLMVNHYVRLGDPGKTRLLENSIAIGAAQAGNIELLSEYLRRGIAEPNNLFANAMFRSNFSTLAYLNEKYNISSDTILRGLNQVYGDGGADNYNLFNWIISNPKIHQKIANELKPGTYLAGLLFQRAAALGTLKNVEDLIIQGVDDFPMALNGASHYGRLDVLEYLLKNYQHKLKPRDLSRAIEWAVDSTLTSEENQIEVIKFLSQNGGRIGGFAFEMAAQKGLNKIAKFLLPYGDGEDYMFEINSAVASGDLQLLDTVYQDLVKKNYEMPSYVVEMIYSSAIELERIDILEWAIEKVGLPQDKEKIMKQAINTCNQEIIDFLTREYKKNVNGV